jgi:hypothetical protein
LNGEFLIFEPEDAEPVSLSVADWFFRARDSLVTGVTNTYSMKPFSSFLFFRLSPKLSIHGLMEDYNKPGVKWRTLKTSKKGSELLAYIQRMDAEKGRNKASEGPVTAEPASASEPSRRSNANKGSPTVKAASSAKIKSRKGHES